MFTATRYPLLDPVIAFADEAYAGLTRKGSGEPYIAHPLAVAGFVTLVPHTPEMLYAAILHDVIEEGRGTAADIERLVGGVAAGYVVGLTPVSRPEDGIRAVRKQIERRHLAQLSAQAQTIKAADMLHNYSDITTLEPRFAKTYVWEGRAAAEVLTQAHPALLGMLDGVLTRAEGVLASA